jgi:two-component system response regulator DegU
LAVLRLLAEGKTNREIAAALDISESTVANHVNHIMDQFQVRDRALAVVHAVRQGILKL